MAFFMIFSFFFSKKIDIKNSTECQILKFKAGTVSYKLALQICPLHMTDQINLAQEIGVLMIFELIN